MLSKLILSLTLLITLFSGVALGEQAQENQLSSIAWQSLNWSELLKENEISIATAKVENSNFVAVKSSMQVNARLNDIAALILFMDGCHEGSTVCDKIEKTESQDLQNYFQYVVSKFPWPLKKRDIFLKIQVKQNEQGIITVDGRAFPDKLPENKRYVRIKKMDLQWKITPRTNGQVLIEHYIHSNPSGRIPAFLFNDAVASTPLGTLGNIKRLLALEKYQKRDIVFIDEIADSRKLSDSKINFD